MISIEEIVNLLNNKGLNGKCNNYIFTQLTDNQIKQVLSKINDMCLISNPDFDFTHEIKKPSLKNIKVDMHSILSKDILTYSLHYLEIDERLDLTDIKALLRYRGILRENGVAVQFILYNIEQLGIDEQRLLNCIYYLNTYFFNINTLTTKDNLVSYEVKSGIYLDDRENYQKIKVKS